MTTVSEERRRTVEAGYDALADRLGEWMERVEGDPWERYLGELAALLPVHARVLALGCGDGSKISRLADRFDVVGVDVSERQLHRAREAVPAATLVHADFTDLECPAQSFDAATALYSIVHTPREEHAALLGRIRRWLKPGGHLLLSMSHVGGPGRVEDWLGVEMFFSGFDAETNCRLVREAGFEVLSDEVEWMHEPEPRGDTAFLWVLARKPE